MARRHKRNPNPKLPDHIIHELLLRLPVKSLSRNKLVCKSWLSIISNPDFVNAHVSKSINDPHFTNHQLILCDAAMISHGYRGIIDPTTRGGDLKIETCSIYSFIYETVTETTKLDFPRKRVDDWTYVVGSCNGLVCLACYDGRTFLWNPTTRKSRRLPKVPKHKHAHTVFGFGYDELKDDYKVFTVVGDSSYKVSVYSSKSDCWRMINGDFPFTKDFIERGKFAYGAIHWEFNPAKKEFNPTKKKKKIEKKIIASLDVKTEAYREVCQPKYGEDLMDWTLGTFRQSLSILCRHENCADFWVMKEYGAEESWTKLFTLPFPWMFPQLINPICNCESGDVMLMIEHDIGVCNPKRGPVGKSQASYKNPSDSTFRETMVYTYVESLVSPPSKLKLAANAP